MTEVVHTVIRTDGQTFSWPRENKEFMFPNYPFLPLCRSNFEKGPRFFWHKMLMSCWNFLCLPSSLTAFDMSPFLSQCTAVLEPKVAQNCQKSNVLPLQDLYQKMNYVEEEFHKVFCVWQYVHYFLLNALCGYYNY